MNVAIYTYNLTCHNFHLMPWHNVLEVARGINRLDGYMAVVLSGSKAAELKRMKVGSHAVYNIPKPINTADIEAIAKVCSDKKIDVLYYPLGWRLPLKKISIIEGKANLKIVWYIPGAWYHLRHVLRAVPSLSLKASLPYIYQAMIPRKIFVKQLLKTGVRPVITMTDYNKAMLEKSGYPADRLFTIPPGKAPLPVVTDLDSTCWDEISIKLAGRPYFLFFGPPQPIRGINHILRAFKEVCENFDKICLVCLFRSDKGLQTDKLRNCIEKMELEKRLFCIWQSVPETDLDAFLGHCYAVLKPFLLVPSEIPLAVIEAAGYGKPVVSTGPDGTGLFAKQFGLMVPPSDASTLAEAMLRLLKDKNLYSEKCSAASRVYKNHPTWGEVAEKWLEVGGTH